MIKFIASLFELLAAARNLQRAEHTCDVRFEADACPICQVVCCAATAWKLRMRS